MLQTFAFEQLFVGQAAEFRHVVTGEQIDAFADLSGDISPLHVSDDFAGSRGFRSRVAHGALLTALASRLFGVMLPGRDCILHSLAMTYVLPVYEGDVLVFSSCIKQISPTVRSCVAEVSVCRGRGEIVARGKAQFGVTETLGLE